MSDASNGLQINAYGNPPVARIKLTPVFRLDPQRGEKRRTAVISRSLDFWLLGGASVLVWCIVLVADGLRAQNSSYERHLANLPFTFSTLTLVCNHPHFISSYNIAYGRGWRFIFTNWFALLFIPFSLLSMFAVSYLSFSVDLFSYPIFEKLGAAQSDWPVRFDLGSSVNLGAELLGLCVWSMWLTVGWHYAKQVFGCMIAYASYDEYPLTKSDRFILRINLLSVALLACLSSGAYSAGRVPYHDASIMQFSVDSWVLKSGYGVFGLSTAVLLCVFVKIFLTRRRLPTLNFLIAGIAFYIWWIPGIFPYNYAAFIVPFFHSLQYLPFSYKMLQSSASNEKKHRFRLGLSTQIALILLVGFLAFDFIPVGLDTQFNSSIRTGCWFFMIAFAVFINVHHFFIDSVIWKSNQPEFKKALF